MDANQIIEGMQACVLTVSKRGIVTYANRSARERLTLSAGDDLLRQLAYEQGLASFLERCATSTTVLQHRLHITRDRRSSPAWVCRGQCLRPDDTTAEHVLLQVERTAGISDSTSISSGKVDAEDTSQNAIELRARELQHRFKNAIQMMMASLDGARRQIHDEAARRALKSAMQQVQAIAHVQTIVTQASAEQTIAAQEFLETLCEAVRDSLALRCNIQCEASVRTIPVEISSHLALIINELVTNAAKYGASDRSAAINVRLDPVNDAIVLCVADSGPGFELAARRKGSGLGLVAELVRQLAGTFTVSSQGGTRCIVEIPGAAHREGERELTGWSAG